MIVLAWKDSEYEIDLFRYDPKTTGWLESPMRQDMPGIDVEATSKRWGVPKETIQEWIDEATAVMKKKYGSEGNRE